MKSILSLTLLFLCTSLFAQFNHLIQSGNDYFMIRDAVVENNTAYLAFDHSDTNSARGGIIKMSDDGQIEWSKKIISPDALNGYSYTILKTADGNYLWHGLAMKADGDHAQIIKFDENGQVLFARNLALGFDGIYYMNNVRQLTNGDFLFFGSLYNQIVFMRMDSNGNFLWSKSITNEQGLSGKNPGFDFVERNDGSFVACGKDESSLALVCLDAGGNLIWNKTLNVGSYIHAKSIAVDDNGSIVLSAECFANNGELVISLLQFSPSGDFLWAKKINGYVPAFAHQKISIDNSLIELSGISSDPLGYLAHYLFQFNGEGQVVASFSHVPPFQSFYDYNTFKRINNQAYVLGGLFDVENQSGLFMNENPSKFNCYFHETDAITSNYEEVTVTNSEFYTQSYGELTSVSIQLEDLPLTTSVYCAALQLEEPEVANLEIFPNPNDGTFQVGLNSSEAQLTITDNFGRFVYSAQIHTQEVIDIREFGSGVYHCTIQEGDQIRRGKVLIN